MNTKFACRLKAQTTIGKAFEPLAYYEGNRIFSMVENPAMTVVDQFVKDEKDKRLTKNSRFSTLIKAFLKSPAGNGTSTLPTSFYEEHGPSYGTYYKAENLLLIYHKDKFIVWLKAWRALTQT